MSEPLIENHDSDPNGRYFDVVDGELQIPKEPEPIVPEEIVVDQQMLDENPVLAEVGEEVGAVCIPATPEQAAEMDAKVAEEAPAPEVVPEEN